MKLVVLGREGLDILQEWVEEIFSAIPNQNLPRNRWDVALYTKDQLLTQTSARPVLESRSLKLQFMHRDEEQFYKSHPSWYMTHLLNHKGPRSIFGLIRAKGWSYELEAGRYTPCAGSGMFTINVDLTEAGLVHYKDVVIIIFQYIAMVRRQPIQMRLVEEAMRMSQIDFRFGQKLNPSYTASSLASVMQKPYDRTMLLSGPSVIRKFDEILIHQSNSYFRPDNFRLTLLDPGCTNQWDKRETWSGTEYKVERLSCDFLKEIQDVFRDGETPAEMHLPHKNDFIPGPLTVEKTRVEQPAKAPILIKHNDNVRTWWKKDDQFWVPEGNIHIYLRTPVTSITVRTELITSLFVHLVCDALVVDLYDANVSGLGYELINHSGGLEIYVNGYSDKLHVLVEKVLHQVRDLVVRKHRFHIVRQSMLHALHELDFAQPWEQVALYSDFFRSKRSFALEDHSKELSGITADDVEAFRPQLLTQCQIEVLANGNLSKTAALSITDLVEQTLKPQPLPSSQLPVARSLVLPPGSNFIYSRDLQDPENANHCIKYSLYAGNRSDKTLCAKLHLLSQITKEPCFNQLRTTKQLGYVVSSVQSERDCGYLESRINNFLGAFEQTLQNMSNKDFECYKNAASNSILAKLTNLDQEDARFWDHITNDSYDFVQADTDAEEIRKLSKEDMIEFFADFISPSSSKRAKLSVHLISQAKSSETMLLGKIPAAATVHTPTLLPQDLSVLEGLRKPGFHSISPSNSKESDFKGLSNINHPVLIKDPYAWKASMCLSASVRPVT
ncbi:LuxS/MPP-like metallohydrolase [Ophiobolus disseminans]|uniref:LuxS/MPP-like metallohydrolase n=1 Tax=Ophiobolus disseminans TaxID=1469910 RepID=A0A6A6ZAQ4_9PLEO|nr:LuxS/MPP-like metallohydrolase [Ophiobolus disseminans]